MLDNLHIQIGVSMYFIENNSIEESFCHAIKAAKRTGLPIIIKDYCMSGIDKDWKDAPIMNISISINQPRCTFHILEELDDAYIDFMLDTGIEIIETKEYYVSDMHFIQDRDAIEIKFDQEVENGS